jgi:hypothetical protein
MHDHAFPWLGMHIESVKHAPLSRLSQKGVQSALKAVTRISFVTYQACQPKTRNLRACMCGKQVGLQAAQACLQRTHSVEGIFWFRFEVFNHFAKANTLRIEFQTAVGPCGE